MATFVVLSLLLEALTAIVIVESRRTLPGLALLVIVILISASLRLRLLSLSRMIWILMMKLAQKSNLWRKPLVEQHVVGCASQRI